MINLARFAEKMRLDLKSVHLNISGLREEGQNPKLTQISVSINLEVERASSQKIQRLISLAEKSCTVSNTLKDKTRISFQELPLK